MKKPSPNEDNGTSEKKKGQLMSILSEGLASYMDEFQKLAAITRWSGGLSYTNPKNIGGRGTLGIGEPVMEAARTDFRKWLGAQPAPKWDVKRHAFTPAELRPARTMEEALGGIKPAKGMRVSRAQGGASLPATPATGAPGGTVATIATPKPARSAPTKLIRPSVPKKPSPAVARGVAGKGTSVVKRLGGLLRKVV